jgi:hypothetical protein
MKEQPEGKAPRLHLYRRAFDRVHWEAGYVDCENYLQWITVSVHPTREAAAIAATRLNGHEPEPRRPKCQWISASGATEPDCGMEAAVTDPVGGLHFCLKHAKGLDGQRELIPVKLEGGGCGHEERT